MKVIGVRSWGGPEKLEMFEVPEPHARAGEVRLRVHAAGVNPTDTLVRNGAQAQRLAAQQPPYIPGMDAAGVVDEVGAGAESRFRAGDRVTVIVAPTLPGKGAYQEFLAVDARSVVQAPAKLDFPHAAAWLMNALTVQMALDSLALQPGQALAITGGTGAVGTAAIQLGKLRGLRLISDVSSSKEDQAWLTALGANDLVPRGEDFVEAVRKLVPAGVAGLLDGAVLNGKAFPAIADGGALVTVRGWKEAGPRGIEVKPVMVGTGLERTDLIEALRDHVNRGELTPRVAKIFPARQAAEAHRFLEAGGVRGRPVLDLTQLG